VAHPFEITMRTELRLPQDWPEKPSEVRIKSDAFEFTGLTAWPERNRVVLTDSYRTLADHVPADRVGEHSDKLAKAANSLGFTVYLPRAGESTGSALDNFNWTVALIGLFFTALLSRLAWAVYRQDPTAYASPQDAHLRGIGGWLLLAALAVITNPLRVAKQLWELLPVFSHASWVSLTTVGGEAYSALWAPLLLFELFAELALLVFAVLMAVLFFRKRSNLPKVWISYCLASVCLMFFDAYLTSLLPANAGVETTASETAAMFRMVIVNIAWAAYFARSRRVRATFVERLARPRTEAAQESNVPGSAASMG
jgi:uncharacterized membrane protein